MKKGTVVIFVLIAVVAFAQVENAYINRGNDYYRQGKYPQAESEYREALNRNPRNNTAKYNLANSLEKQQKYKEAQEIYDELTRTEDNNLRALAYYNTGVVYSGQKELESSIEAYKNALRINPDDRQARENLQKALSELKKKNSGGGGGNDKSNMSSSAADKKLKELQEKEKDVQKRLQGAKKGTGGTTGPDW